MIDILKARARLGTASRYGTEEERADAHADLRAAVLSRDIDKALNAGLKDEHRAELSDQLLRPRGV